MPLKKIYLELTDACNLNCEICYRKTWGNLGSHMQESVLKQVIDEIQSNAVNEIILGGIGEPTIHPQFYWVLDQLKNLEITLTTNGTTIDARMADALVENVDKMVVSVDGSQLVYDRVRGFEYNQLIHNLNLLNQAKLAKGKTTPHLMIQMVISKDNLTEVSHVVDIAAKLKADTLILSNLLPVTPEDSHLILYTQYDNSEIKAFFNRIRSKALRYGLEIKLTETKLKIDRHCNFIEKSAMVINARGEVVPCYRFAHHGTEVVFGRFKAIEKVVFGNVADQPLNIIWNDNAYSSFRNMVLKNHYPSCPDCDLVDGCDFVRTTSGDCYGNTPSCADCLWSRNLIYCI